MKAYIFSALLISAAIPAHATQGHDRGNGGDAIICKNPNGKVKYAQFFDLYEAQAKFSMKLIPPQGKNLDEKVVDLINRVTSQDPVRAQVMKNWYTNFFKETLIRPGMTMVDIPDTGTAFWPAGCELAQLVVQTDVNLPLQPFRYTISQDIWDLLDENDKAATVIHELLLREGREHEAYQTSAGVRYLNGLIWADTLKSYSHQQYVNLIYDLQLMYFTSASGLPASFAQVPKDLFNGVTFVSGTAIFEIPGNKNLGSICEVNPKDPLELCKNQAPDLIGLMKSPPQFPDSFYATSNIEAEMPNGVLTFLGALFLKAKPNLFLTQAIYLAEQEAWEISNRGFLTIVVKDATLSTSIKFPLGRIVQNVLSFDDSDYYSPSELIVSRNEKLLRLKWFVSADPQTFTLDVHWRGKREIVCRSHERIDIDFIHTRLESCVLDKDTTLIDYRLNNPKEILVRAGKRIKVNGYFEVLEIK